MKHRASRRQLVTRYSTGTPPMSDDLRHLLRAAGRNPYDDAVHGAVADELDTVVPGTHVANLIREWFGHGEYGGTGGRENMWYDKAARDAWSSVRSYHLGRSGPFNVYLRHEGIEHHPTGAVPTR